MGSLLKLTFPILALLFRPLPSLASAAADSSEDPQVHNLFQNVDRAFLRHYLHQNKAKTRKPSKKLQKIALSMIDASGTAFQKKYHVYVVNDPEPYAAASPDGYLFIHTGMFKLKLSDAETAALIGHELGHVILKHWLARLQRELPPDLLEKYAEKTYPVDSPRIARLYRAVRHTGYTPDEEYEADMAGAQFLADDAYPPKSMPGLLKKLYKNRRGKKGKDPYLAVHPLTPARIKQIEAQVPLVKPRTKRLF